MVMVPDTRRTTLFRRLPCTGTAAVAGVAVAAEVAAEVVADVVESFHDKLSFFILRILFLSFQINLGSSVFYYLMYAQTALLQRLLCCK